MLKTKMLFGFLLLVFLYILICNENHNLENFDYLDNIQTYIITLKTQNRLDNIEKQKSKLNTNAILFDAVVGDRLNLEELINNGVLSDEFRNGDTKKKREIGCYMSHLNLYKKIKESNSSGYTLILEDDFVVIDNTNIDTIKECIKKINNKGEDFDMLFLGNLYRVHGEIVIDNIYKDDKNKELLCTHAYIVNNSHINKIINLTSKIEMSIDWTLNKLSKNGQLKMLVVYPIIIDQGGGDTLINNNDIELFQNYR